MTTMGIILLRRGIFWRTHATHNRLRARVIGIPQLHQPKIHQHCLAGSMNNHILRLDIAVDDAFCVTVRQSIKQLATPRNNLGFGLRSLTHQFVCQTLPQHKIHYKIGIATILEEIRHAYKIRMAESRKNCRFPTKLITQTSERRRIQSRLRTHFLKCDRDIQSRVPGAIDRPHTSLTQQSHNTIALL
ncbi:MAG: hypothetical protein BWY63_03885 [Chloroflexi bacterium ADurb.Bin360]|nr:MAG: hypothetical protein BWY63_03885 [Chloroflexi bacterium ADurb.Bin360]